MSDRLPIADAVIVSMDAAVGVLRGDLLIEGGAIRATGPGLGASDALRIDARGKLAIPGLVDAHRHGLGWLPRCGGAARRPSLVVSR